MSCCANYEPTRSAMETSICQKRPIFRIPYFRPSKCRPLESAAGGECPPLAPSSRHHWIRCCWYVDYTVSYGLSKQVIAVSVWGICICCRVELFLCFSSCWTLTLSYVDTSSGGRCVRLLGDSEWWTHLLDLGQQVPSWQQTVSRQQQVP